MIGKGSRNDKYQTPPWFFDILHNRFNFTVDSASDESNKVVPFRFTDGLKESWADHRVFCNPPFSQKKLWIEKAHNEVRGNLNTTCVMLLPTNSMSSSFWHEFIFGKYHYEVLNKRLNYVDPETGKEAKGADSGTTIVYFMAPLPSKYSV